LSGGAPFPGDGGKAQKAFGLLADLGEYLGFGVLGYVVGDRQGAVGGGAFGMHHPLGDSRLKCACFSNSCQSCTSTGPRSPAVNAFWLSATGIPPAVVSVFGFSAINISSSFVFNGFILSIWVSHVFSFALRSLPLRQALANVSRIQIEKIADVDERKDPLAIVVENPRLRFGV
jgi:hypothetical protein